MSDTVSGAADLPVKMNIGGGHPSLQHRIPTKQCDKSTESASHLRSRTARLTPGISLEEYMFWATRERQIEEQEETQKPHSSKVQRMLACVKLISITSQAPEADQPSQRNSSHVRPIKPLSEGTDSVLDEIPSSEGFEEERERAIGASRTVGWMMIFYLITTDILGWMQTPYVFASIGYGLASGAFITFGIAAAAAGFMIWRTFLGLDSSRYPVLNFGDLYFRIYGPKARHLINGLQAFQMICSVAVILIGNSQKLSQLLHGKVCYMVVVLICLVIGVLSAFLRYLKHISWICVLGLCINVTNFVIIMVAASKHGPDPKVALQTTLLKEIAPVRAFVGIPPAQYQQRTKDIVVAIFNAIDSIAYAYYGAILFCAFLAEMRRPSDFWKGMLMAQMFICFVYLLFGSIVYHYIGQYSIPLVTQVISPHRLQVVCNINGLIMGFIASFLYFNVGLKIVYSEVGQEILGLPPITQRKGYTLWLASGVAYWVLAMIIAISVPDFAGITNLVSGLLIVNFTYSIPGIIFAAFIIQRYSALPNEGFDPRTGVTTRHDTGWKRHLRGLKRSWYISVPVIIFSCAGLSCSGLGTWSAVKSLILVFGKGGTIQTTWGCRGPG